MASILDTIVAHKLKEIEIAKARRPLKEVESLIDNSSVVRDFLGALTGEDVALIAEVKKASPSKGLIRDDFDPITIAEAYQKGGASCVSVLTDERFFQGHLDYLVAIRAHIDIPVLRKDFILDVYQVYESRAAGADAVLLVAECLDATQLKRLHDQVVELGMTPLVELYESTNIEKVLRCRPKLVGINNRDLNTFETDLQHVVRLREQIPDDILVIGESGIFSHDDVLMLKAAGIDAILVGESLMRSTDICNATRDLLGQ